MFKVMIVYDEPSTRQGLETIISWKDFGFEVVGFAENGNEAIDKYQSLTPNLMIVDMKMHGMSGIELIEKIREVDSYIEFIVLSGYADFEFARKAIKYNVKGYLLKPVDEDELISFLHEIKLRLKEKFEFSKIKAKINEENKEQIIQTALSGNCKVELKELYHHLEWSTFRILLIEVVNNRFSLNEIKKQLQDYFIESNKGFVFTINPHVGILLNADLRVNNNLIHLYKAVHKNIQTKFIASISQPFKEIEDLKTHFKIALDIIKEQFYYEDGIILKTDSKPAIKVEEDVMQFQLSKAVNQLAFAMEVGDQQVIERICMDVCKYMIYKNFSERSIKEKYIQIVTLLLKKLMYDHEDIHLAISSILSRVYEIENQSNVIDLLTYVNSLLSEMLGYIDSNETDILVKKMINLIEQNYHNNIKLENLSKVLNYNRAYLGKLFKDYTGEYFNTYLDKIRIEKAKELLLQGLKVYQVAERSGFSNVDYFYSKFKKYEGVSPSYYRKNNQS
ncbi:response regulator transcription factor [Halalkalibacterium halodurans]|uniref:response regulator transcription factor n=1 Tax=Halalkalibacterium halodurans TaxID=86665 RepID=UPI002AA9FC8A|nr:response regulator transcription factor [Halalkalibacterium halodurans]MDY7224700.1 response regulator transcription factor [Halalkalibacterium halodurans]MDY7243920.1 response regulator transcription factor [Halalkalibacterium halodurans]